MPPSSGCQGDNIGREGTAPLVLPIAAGREESQENRNQKLHDLYE